MKCCSAAVQRIKDQGRRKHVASCEFRVNGLRVKDSRIKDKGPRKHVMSCGFRVNGLRVMSYQVKDKGQRIIEC
jgi:hypothetical protein